MKKPAWAKSDKTLRLSGLRTKNKNIALVPPSPMKTIDINNDFRQQSV